MTRSYRAARRRKEQGGAPFDYRWVDVEEVRDEDGNVVSEVETERVEHFVAHGRVNTLLLSELAYNADLDTATPEAMALIRQVFAGAFGVRTREVVREVVEDGVLVSKVFEEVVDDDASRQYKRFFKLHSQHGDDDLLMEIMQGLVEDLSGRPTQQPSPSPAGELTTGTASKVVSFSKRSVELVPSPEEGQAVSS